VNLIPINTRLESSFQGAFGPGQACKGRGRFQRVCPREPQTAARAISGLSTPCWRVRWRVLESSGECHPIYVDTYISSILPIVLASTADRDWSGAPALQRPLHRTAFRTMAPPHRYICSTHIHKSPLARPEIGGGEGGVTPSIHVNRRQPYPTYIRT